MLDPVSTGTTMKLRSTLGWLRVHYDITSCVDIYMQQDKRPEGDAGGRAAARLRSCLVVRG